MSFGNWQMIRQNIIHVISPHHPCQRSFLDKSTITTLSFTETNILECKSDKVVECLFLGCLRDEWTTHLDVCMPARPVCITQLIEEARQEAATFAAPELMKYFTAVEWCKYIALGV